MPTLQCYYPARDFLKAQCLLDLGCQSNYLPERWSAMGKSPSKARAALAQAASATSNSWTRNKTLEFSSEDPRGPNTSLASSLQKEAGEEWEPWTWQLPAAKINHFSCSHASAWTTITDFIIPCMCQFYHSTIQNMKKNLRQMLSDHAQPTPSPQLRPCSLSSLQHSQAHWKSCRYRTAAVKTQWWPEARVTAIKTLLGHIPT